MDSPPGYCVNAGCSCDAGQTCPDLKPWGAQTKPLKEKKVLFFRAVNDIWRRKSVCTHVTPGSSQVKGVQAGLGSSDDVLCFRYRFP